MRKSEESEKWRYRVRGGEGNEMGTDKEDEGEGNRRERAAGGAKRRKCRRRIGGKRTGIGEERTRGKGKKEEK